MRFHCYSNGHLAAMIIVYFLLSFGPLLMVNARGQAQDMKEIFSLAKSRSELRAPFLKVYIQSEGLPAHVIRMRYSEQMESMCAITRPLVQVDNGKYRPTSHALAIGRSYPSSITFGPEMFISHHRYADFLSVIQHEAAHAKFWATGELNYLDRVDTGKDSKVRLRGLLPILFELDALKTQMAHPSWTQTSGVFRRGQEAYRQEWLEKLEQLEQQSYVYDMRALLNRIRRTYK